MTQERMPVAPYRLTLPHRRRTGVLFSSPHSGRAYPPDMLDNSMLDARLIRSSEDAFVDRLLASVPDHGAVLLAATAPRAYIDLNRAPDELDPALIEGVRQRGINPRITAGLGVVPRVVSGGRAIYAGKMSREEADRRITRFWRPYHARLIALMDELHAEFGSVVLIDMHSMPHEALDSLGARRPQIVLGDRYGAAASGAVMAAVEAAFAAEGLRVERNAPFAGAYITQTYGRPAMNRHAVQIEIDRALYMDERRVLPHAGFEDFAALMARVLARIAGIGRPGAMPLAAE